MCSLRCLVSEQDIKIADFEIGGDIFIIAELSANHNQDINLAKSTIKSAKLAGADAIKLQTYTPDSLTLDVKSSIFKAGDLWSDKYLYDLYKSASMPYEWHKELFEYAKEIGIIIFSSPFDLEGIDLLEELNAPAYKIASFEITHIPLIKAVASKHKPIIISTGIASSEDIELAIQTCKDEGNNQIILLKCTSSYPAPLEDMNLIMIEDMALRYGLVVGLSDHTLGIEAPIVSVAFGAKVIEKHFIYNKDIETFDSEFSLDPKEFKDMVTGVRNAQKLIGKIDYNKSDKSYARSIFVSADIKEGDRFTTNNIKVIRPGQGLHPKYYDKIIGKRASMDLSKGEPFMIEFIK